MTEPKDVAAMAVLRAILIPYARFKRNMNGQEAEDNMNQHIEALDWAIEVVPMDASS